MTTRHEFLGDAWLEVVRGTFAALAPQTVEVLGERWVTFAEVYTEAPTPSGIDGWYVTIGHGEVQRCARGGPDRPADHTVHCTLHVAHQLAAAQVVDPHLTVSRQIGPDADVETLLRLGPIFAGVHEEMARQTLVP